MKFKLGELVQLSAAGKNRTQNTSYDGEGAYGMVVGYKRGQRFPVICHWFGGLSKHSCYPHADATFKAYELKRKRT
jgi:hypothetical protein